MLAAAIVAGCGADASAPAATPDPVVDAGSLELLGDGALLARAGEEIEVQARVTPADGRIVRFALLDDAGDSSLARAEAATDGQGIAKTRLRAASRAATFRVRASSGGATAERPVAVTGTGVAAIVVTPDYAGKRDLGGWKATASTAGRCSDTSSPVRADGPLSADASMKIAGVPVGARIVIAVRAGHAVGGCTELDDLSIGETRALAIPVLDAPLSVAPLRASVNVVAADGPSAQLVAAWRARFEEALLGGETAPARALLDAVALALPSPMAPGFLAAQKAGGWDALVQAAHPDAPAKLTAWLDAGAARMREGLSLDAELTTLGDGAATLAPLSASGAQLDPSSAPPRPASWAALPGDVARLSSDLSLPATRLLAAAIESASGAKGATTLAELLGCADASKQLATVAQLGCDEACFAAACASATEAMWQRARRSDELSGKLTKLTITTTLDAVADAEARLLKGAGAGTITATSSGVEWTSDATSTLVAKP